MSAKSQMLFVCDSCGKSEALDMSDPARAEEALSEWWTTSHIVAGDEFEDPNEKAQHYCSSACLRRAHGG